MNKRLETGVFQEGDDWPGVFIRGDNAAYYAMQLSALLAGQTDVITVSACKSLASLLKSSHVSSGETPQVVELTLPTKEQ